MSLRVLRQDAPGEAARWERFTVPRAANMNVISCLQYVAAHPVTAEGKATSPIVFDCNCLEEVCGACTMLVNGRARQACSALVESLLGEGPGEITLEPLTKFPVVRDLFVDRQRLFDDLKRARAWVPIDGTYDLGPGPNILPALQEQNYPLSRCISCGCCLEACPQYGASNGFIGAAVISQARLFNDHPVGAALREERLGLLMGEDGVGSCAKAGNCVEVCPKEIPLLESIAAVQRQATLHAVGRFFSK